jgi:DNA-directed RNA polymerase omega subunit
MYNISLDRLGTKYGNVYELVIVAAVHARDVYNQDDQNQAEEGDQQMVAKTTTRALRDMVTELDNSEN